VLGAFGLLNGENAGEIAVKTKETTAIRFPYRHKKRGHLPSFSKHTQILY